MTNNKPKGIKIDPSRLQKITTKSEHKTTSPTKSKDRKKNDDDDDDDDDEQSS